MRNAMRLAPLNISQWRILDDTRFILSCIAIWNKYKCLFFLTHHYRLTIMMVRWPCRVPIMVIGGLCRVTIMIIGWLCRVTITMMGWICKETILNRCRILSHVISTYLFIDLLDFLKYIANLFWNIELNVFSFWFLIDYPKILLNRFSVF